MTQKLLLLVQRAGISTGQGPHSFPSPHPWCIALSFPSLHDRDSRRCPGTKSNARWLRHVEPGRQRVILWLYFLFWILSPVCRLPGSTHVSVSVSFSLFLTLYVLCFRFETSVPILCYLSSWVSPEECFGDRDILHPVGRVEGFNHALSPQEVGGDRWQWCLNHQELAISLRKTLHGTL